MTKLFVNLNFYCLQLKGFEIIKAVHLEPEPFDIERDLITPTYKIKRPQMLKYYKVTPLSLSLTLHVCVNFPFKFRTDFYTCKIGWSDLLTVKEISMFFGAYVSYVRMSWSEAVLYILILDAVCKVWHNAFRNQILEFLLLFFFLHGCGPFETMLANIPSLGGIKSFVLIHPSSCLVHASLIQLISICQFTFKKIFFFSQWDRKRSLVMKLLTRCLCCAECDWQHVQECEQFPCMKNSLLELEFSPI